jgi:hypothetical protein
MRNTPDKGIEDRVEGVLQKTGIFQFFYGFGKVYTSHAEHS